MPSSILTPPITPAKAQDSRSHIASRTGSGVNATAIRTLKRHRVVYTDAIQGIKKQSIRRLARRGGVKRIQPGIYDATKEVMVKRIREVLGRVVKIVEHCNRKTVNTMDIVMALKDMPMTSMATLSPIYGYGWPMREFPEPRTRTRTRTRTATDDAERAYVVEIEKSAAVAASTAAETVTPTTTITRHIRATSTPEPEPETRVLAHRRPKKSKKPKKSMLQIYCEGGRVDTDDDDDEDSDDAHQNDADDEEEWDFEAERKSYRLRREAREHVAAWERRMAMREEERLARLALVQRD